MVKIYDARINTGPHLPCIQVSIDFHGNLGKIHLNQLSDLGLRAKLSVICNRAVWAGTMGREFDFYFVSWGTMRLFLKARHASPSQRAFQPLNACPHFCLCDWDPA
jgi:hypothetical protein